MYLSMAVHRLGGAVVVVGEFDAAETLETIERHEVTHAMMAPYMFVRLLKLPEAKRTRHSVASLRRVLVSFAPSSVAVKRAMIDWWGPVFLRLYGSSEKAGGAIISSQEWLAHPGSVGRPVAGTVHIVNDDGTELPPGRIGRICFSDDGRDWVDIGDVGYVDQEGYLYHVDRKASEIRTGSGPVYPQQVEDVLVSHPLVLDAAVFGVPDALGATQIRAVVRLVDNTDAAAVSGSSLIGYCRDRLTAAQCPAVVTFGPVPRSDTGKVYRRHLQRDHLAAITDRESIVQPVK
jgi:fatty-acyl-CoA synthase